MNKIEVSKICQLANKKIARVADCEPDNKQRPVHLYLEFHDGSHFEIYSQQEMHFTGVVEYKEELGSVAENIFNLALINETIVAITGYHEVVYSDEIKKVVTKQ